MPATTVCSVIDIISTTYIQAIATISSISKFASIQLDKSSKIPQIDTADSHD